MSVKQWNIQQINTTEQMNTYLRVNAGVLAQGTLQLINFIEGYDMSKFKFTCEEIILNSTLYEYHKCVYKAYCYFHNKNKKKFNKYFNKSNSISRDVMDYIGELCEKDVPIEGFYSNGIKKSNDFEQNKNEETYKGICNMMGDTFNKLNLLKEKSLNTYYYVC